MAKGKRNLVSDSLRLACAEIRKFVANPELLKGLPPAADGTRYVVFLPVNDPELMSHNIQAFVRHVSKGLPPDAKIEVSIEEPSAKNKARRVRRAGVEMVATASE